MKPIHWESPVAHTPEREQLNQYRKVLQVVTHISILYFISLFYRVLLQALYTKTLWFNKSLSDTFCKKALNIEFFNSLSHCILNDIFRSGYSVEEVAGRGPTE